MKKIMIILLVFTLIITLLTCCKKTEKNINDTSEEVTQETTNPEEAIDNLNEPIIIDADDESQSSSFEVILKSFDNGDIDEETYHTSVVSLVLGTSENAASYRENEFVDPSMDAQWLVDNYNSLDAQGKSLVDQLRRIEPLSSDSSSINIPFVIRSHASGTEEPEYPKKIMEGAYLTLPDENLTLPENIVNQIISDYTLNADLLGLPLGISRSTYRIVISVYPMAGPASSLSFLDRDINFGGESLPTFYIHLDMGANSDTLKGALLHELFHAYQHELGYERLSAHDNFMMESTAIWAVKHTDSELEYPDQFDTHLYNSDLQFDVDTMNDNLMKSWYQLPYMMVDELGEDDFVLKYLRSGLSTISLNETFNDTFGNPVTTNDRLANFGKYLIADVDNSDIDIPIDAPYFSDSLMPSQYVDIDFDVFSHREDADAMSTYDMLAPGYYPVHIDLTDYKDGFLHIVSNTLNIAEHNNAGLVVFYKKDDNWKLAIDGRMDSFRISELEIKEFDTTDLLFLFFNHNDVTTNQKYSLIMQEKILGEGSIQVEIDVDYKDPEDDAITDDEAVFYLNITENIELLVGENTDTDMGMAAKFMIGDVYYVKDFEASISGDRLTNYANGDTTHTSYYGQFRFNEGDALPGDLPNTLLGPEMSSMLSGIFGDNSSTGGFDLGGLLDGSSGLEGIDMGGMDLGALLGDEATADLNAELSEARDELGDIDLDLDAISMFMPNPNKLMRLKSVIQNETFHVYPTLPLTLESSDWVNAETIRNYTDASGERKSETTNTTTTLTFNAIPLWFRNPYYSPTNSEELMLQFPSDPNELAQDYTDMDSVMDQIILLNGKYDETNLYNAFDDGVYTFDLSEISSSKTGTQTQELSLPNEDTFIGLITGDYSDASGSKFLVEIKIKYEYQ